MADEAPELPHVNIPDPFVPATSVDIPKDGGLNNSLESTDPADKPPETPAAPVAETLPAEAEKPKPLPKKSPFQARIDTLTAKNAEAERQRAEIAAERDMFRAMAEGKTEGKVAPTEAEIERLVEQRAAAREIQRSTQRIISAGNAEYPDFTERCNVVAALGAGDRQDFMQVIADPEIIPDGQKIIAQLAERPEEAAQIFAPHMTTAQMTAKLLKFQMEHSKPPANTISKVPPPIKPIDGQTRAGTTMNDSEPMESYAAKFYADKAKRLQRK